MSALHVPDYIGGVRGFVIGLPILLQLGTPGAPPPEDPGRYWWRWALAFCAVVWAAVLIIVWRLIA